MTGPATTKKVWVITTIKNGEGVTLKARKILEQVVSQGFLKVLSQDFLGRPVVRTQRIHCQGPRFNPWSGN